MGEVFASAPFIVGKSEPSPTESHIPAEEALCPVMKAGRCIAVIALGPEAMRRGQDVLAGVESWIADMASAYAGQVPLVIIDVQRLGPARRRDRGCRCHR